MTETIGFNDDLDLDAAPEPTDADHRRLTNLVVEQAARQRQIEILEAELDTLKRAHDAAQTKDLPEALLACGYLPPSKPTISAYVVDFKETYRCGQLDDAPDDEKGKKRPLEDRLRGLKWLDENDASDLARRKLIVTLGAASEDTAIELMDLIKSHRASNQFTVEHLRVVPWSTLAAFTREFVKEGGDPPLDDLGVRVMRTADVKEPK